MSIDPFDRKAFFDSLRRSDLFGGLLSTSVVAGIERIMDAWGRYGTGVDDALAYVLATAGWETGRRWQPIRETTGPRDKVSVSDATARARLEKAFKAGKLAWVSTPYWRDGWYGRGDVQLTHEANYKGPLREAVLKEFGVDIHADPDVAMRPDVSAFILVEGMTKGLTGRADFTGHALEQFINAGKTDFVNARRVVNPGDKTSFESIAKMAAIFAEAIRAGRAGVAPVDVPTPRPKPETTVAVLSRVQQRLRDLGYPEVGRVDGKWGSKTAAAILAFRNDNGLPLVPEVDQELLVALMTASPRPVAAERAKAEVEDLKDAKAVKDGLTLDRIGKIVGIGGAVTAGGIGGLDLAELTEKVGRLQALGAALKSALPFLLVAAVGLAVVFYARRLIREHVQAYREGRHV